VIIIKTFHLENTAHTRIIIMKLLLTWETFGLEHTHVGTTVKNSRMKIRGVTLSPPWNHSSSNDD